MNDLTVVDNTAVLLKAEIDMQVTTAKAYPRDLKICVQKAMQAACFSQQIAAACMYTKPVGKSDKVSGASIRLAEIMISAWTNIHCSTRLTRNDGKFISIEAIVIDRETNTIYSETVERSIMTSAKDGKTPRQYSYDMIQNTAAAGASIALRKAAFRLFGKHFVDLIYEATKEVALGRKPSTMGDTQSFEVVRQKAIAQFEKSGIPPEKIYNYFGITTLTELTDDHLIEMMGVKNAIKEGDMKKENAFEINLETGEVIPTKADEANEKLNLPQPASLDKDDLPY